LYKVIDALGTPENLERLYRGSSPKYPQAPNINPSCIHEHDHPVIHRDLKCDNILVNGYLGQANIGDLGLTAILRGSTPTHGVICTSFFYFHVFFCRQMLAAGRICLYQELKTWSFS